MSRIQVSRSIKNSKNETNNSIKAEVVSYDRLCMTCKSGTVTQKIERLPEIIVISGDQLKSQENIPEYFTINRESSTWLHYNGLASIKTKMVKRPTILNGEKLGFLIYAS